MVRIVVAAGGADNGAVVTADMAGAASSAPTGRGVVNPDDAGTV